MTGPEGVSRGDPQATPVSTPASPLVPVPLPLDAATPLPLPVRDDRLDTPAMLIDLDVAEANIAKMAAFAGRAGLRLRPHIKTHKSVDMARRQLAAGAAGLCVATVTEAAVMAGAGLRDLTLAYPVVGQRKLERLAEVCRIADVTLVADSPEVADGYRSLARLAGRGLDVLIEVDTGMHRAGAAPDRVTKLAQHIAQSGTLRFRGILTHAGHAHDAAGQLGIERVARAEAAVMGGLREDLEYAGHEVDVVSAGSTLTARYLSAADGITEIRPGTYVYNDLRTLACWSCTPDEIAATMLATVVSTDGQRITVDAGSKTLTSTADPAFGAGHLLGRPDSAFTRVSEEHGVLTVPGEPDLRVGDRVQILPVHSCVWTDLQPEIYCTRQGQIVERIRVDAFRHSL
jgi:D-serine deaminase-like pyridoxal phosphate-dependent protein